VDNHELAAMGRDLLNILSSAERKIVEMRFGIDDGYVHTSEEIGFVFNKKPSEIEEIIDNSMKKLQKHVQSNKGK
jgi:RNA polymerase primary sigma factor